MLFHRATAAPRAFCLRHARGLARLMGHDKAAGRLQRILDEEGPPTLSAVAEGGINQRAAEAGEDQAAEDEDRDGTTPRKRHTELGLARTKLRRLLRTARAQSPR